MKSAERPYGQLATVYDQLKEDGSQGHHPAIIRLYTWTCPVWRVINKPLATAHVPYMVFSPPVD